MAIDVSSAIRPNAYMARNCSSDIPCWCCWGNDAVRSESVAATQGEITPVGGKCAPDDADRWALATVYQASQRHALDVERLEGLNASSSADSALAAFSQWLESRDTLLHALELPATAHNSLQLYDAALAGLPLSAALADMDTGLPAAVRCDEVLLLTALADHFHRRAIDDPAARVYDIEAFLGVPHHDHNAAVISSWLACELPFYAMLASLVTGEEALESAVC